MANPVYPVECPKDVWTKIATNVTSGNFYRIDLPEDPSVYLQTHRITGQAAPDNVTDKAEGVPMFSDYPNREEIKTSTAIDIYCMPLGKDGVLRADL